MHQRIIQAQSRQYPVIIAEGLLERIAEQLHGVSTVVMVSDEDAAGHWGAAACESLYAAGMSVYDWVLPVGEQSKSLWQAEALYDFLVSKSIDRQAAIVALGGGVVGDLAGFVASTWQRGVRFVNCPTSLLAAVDASVGETALNHVGVKNCIGTFYQPAGVLIDPRAMRTLPEPHLRSGLAESIKHALIADEEFLSWHAQHADLILNTDLPTLAELFMRNVEIKARFVELDERDCSGERAKLNLGHTVGHALESISGYGLLHGEAVALGMCAAFDIARQRGLIGSEEGESLRSVLKMFELPTSLPADWDLPSTLTIMRSDKKSIARTIRFVLPQRVGEVSDGHEVSEDDILSALNSLCP